MPQRKHPRKRSIKSRPDDVPDCVAFLRGQRQSPLRIWFYRSPAGHVLMAEALYESNHTVTVAGSPGCQRTVHRRDILLWSMGPTVSDGVRWRVGALPDPRPLFGLDKLVARRTAPVLLVEGCRAAEAAALHFPSLVVMTWSGGPARVDRYSWHDWSVLEGRDVILWPDFDVAGASAMHTVAKHLSCAGVRSVRCVDLSQRMLPDGWDCADGTTELCTAILLEGLGDYLNGMDRTMAHLQRIACPT